jgi:hypothetical protein
MFVASGNSGAMDGGQRNTHISTRSALEGPYITYGQAQQRYTQCALPQGMANPCEDVVPPGKAHAQIIVHVCVLVCVCGMS